MEVSSESQSESDSSETSSDSESEEASSEEDGKHLVSPNTSIFYFNCDHSNMLLLKEDVWNDLSVLIPSLPPHYVVNILFACFIVFIDHPLISDSHL